MRERVFARFLPLAAGKLKQDPESADAFASHIANANEAIHIATQLCTAPNALQTSTLAAMLERWLRLLAEYETPSRLVSSLKAQAAPVPQLDSAVALLLHARIFEIGVAQRGLSESDALQLASLLARAMPAFWLLAQHSDSSERASQKELIAVLKAALGQPLAFAIEASHVFLDQDGV